MEYNERKKITGPIHKEHIKQTKTYDKTEYNLVAFYDIHPGKALGLVFQTLELT